MRISLLILVCILSATRPSLAQFYTVPAPHDPGRPATGVVHVPVGSAEGLHQLESAAWRGDRRASALLAALLQDRPEIADGLVTSALHFQVAIAAGYTDLDGLSAQAVARLSAEQSLAYQKALPLWVPEGGRSVMAGLKGRCLTW
ncbi:hypothetical protein [Devosia beringensis]|uniref:hypothetical protein n=1 Tax=Devosia beringensis TaxID=2657486 RepID=UPI00186B690B|nr:hypothetical protein [Devosia beringensis]